MKHMSRDRGVIRHLLERARTVAVVGASPSPERHSHTVTRYLSHAGYDVVPVRPDRCEVAGLPSYATLADVAGPIDLVVIFRRPDAVVPHIAEAAAKHAEAIWLPPGAWSPEAEAAAQQHTLTVIKERCIEDEHRHLAQRSGHPEKWGVHVRRRKPTYEDNRRRPEAGGYVAGGGGGHVAGGGVRFGAGRKEDGEREAVSAFRAQEAKTALMVVVRPIARRSIGRLHTLFSGQC